jgi:hypothetical protein
MQHKCVLVASREEIVNALGHGLFAVVSVTCEVDRPEENEEPLVKCHATSEATTAARPRI